MSAVENELPEITVTADRSDVASYGRQPRAVVKINDTVCPGWLEWSVSNNSYYEADTFQVKFATSALPDAMNAQWFSKQTETFVEIIAGFPLNAAAPDPADRKNMKSLIYGRIDGLAYDPVQGTLEMHGRDLTGCFIDAKIDQNYANKKASEIAILLAQKHDLAYRAAPTSTYVGNYYKNDFSLLAANRSEWDLLAYLARQEGFVCYVIGQILWFAPELPNFTDPYLIKLRMPRSGGGTVAANVTSIEFDRDQTVAKGITVTVSSAGQWNGTVRYSYPSAPKAIAPGKSSPYGPTTNYYYRMAAGATPAQVKQMAQQYYNQIISHAMKLSARMPADNVLTPRRRMTIQVAGTGTDWDQIYYPKVVTRSMSFDGGYTMDVQAQNTSPALEQPDDPEEPQAQADPLNEVNVTKQ